MLREQCLFELSTLHFFTPSLHQPPPSSMHETMLMKLKQKYSVFDPCYLSICAYVRQKVSRTIFLCVCLGGGGCFPIRSYCKYEEKFCFSTCITSLSFFVFIFTLQLHSHPLSSSSFTFLLLVYKLTWWRE